MSEHSVERLFDEFATAYRRGERPDVGVYLERAGGERDDLARMLDGFLQAVPAREPSEEEIVLVQARLEKEPALLVLRRRRKLTREAVVSTLVSALGLDPAKRERVADYYHGLEVGTLDPKPVSSRVWAVLGDFLQVNVRELVEVVPKPPPAQAIAYRRFATDAPRHLASWDEDVTADRLASIESVDAPSPASPPPPDEVDMLFTGGA